MELGSNVSHRRVDPTSHDLLLSSGDNAVGRVAQPHPSLQLELKLSWSNEPEPVENCEGRLPGSVPEVTNPCSSGASPVTCCDKKPERFYWRCSDEEDDSGRMTRKKLRLTKEQSCYLEESFKEHPTLNPKQKLVIAKKLNLRPRQVEVWFQNRRARTKLKQTEVDFEYLKRCCESLTEENRRLHKELQEVRAIKSPLPNLHVYSPVASLTLCPSCEKAAVTEGGSKRSGSFSIRRKQGEN